MRAALLLACSGPTGTHEGCCHVLYTRRHRTRLLPLPIAWLGIAGLILALAASHATAQSPDPPQPPIPPALLAAEDTLASGRFAAAARAFGAIVADSSVPAPLRARAARGMTVAHDCRGEIGAEIAAMAQAVAADPAYPGNPALVDQMGNAIVSDGPPPDVDDLLAMLDVAATQAKALRANVIQLHVLKLNIEGRFADARDRAAELQRVTDFVAGGPFDNGGGAGIDEIYPPERGVRLDETMQDRHGRPIHWMHVPAYNGSAHLDVYFDDEPDAVGYVATAVKAPGPGPAVLCLNGSGAFRLWLNGELVLDEHEVRSGSPGLYEIPVELVAGWNQILVKAAAETENLILALRATDPMGDPLPLECSSTQPALSSAPVKTTAAGTTIPRGLERFPADGWFRRWSRGMANAPDADRYLYVDALLARDFLDEAEAAIAAAADAGAGSPSHGQAVIESMRSSLLITRGDNEQAQAHSSRIAALYPESVAAQIGLLTKLRGEGDNTTHDRVLNDAIAMSGNNPILRAARGAQFILNGHVKEGLAEIEQVVATTPGNVMVRDLQLTALEKQENTKAVETATLDALRVRPDYPDFALRAAEIAAGTGDTDRSIGYLRHARDAGARPDEIQEKIADAYRSEGRTKEAVAALEEGLRWSPLDDGMTGTLAELALEQGHMEEAKPLLARQIELEPTAFRARAKLREIEKKPPLRDLFPTTDVQELTAADLGWADPDIGAVILLTEEQVARYPDGASETWAHIVVKVRNESGIDSIRKLPVPSRLGGGEVEIARTIKDDGRMIEADKGFKEVAFKELEPGDVAEVRFVVRDGPAPGLAEHFWHTYMFQQGAPCLRSRLALLTPAGMKFETRMHNATIEPRLSSRGEWQLAVWEMEKLPGEPNEVGLPPDYEQLAWIDISTVRSWDTIATWYDAMSRGRIRPTLPVKRAAGALADSALVTVGGTPRAVAADSVLIRTVAEFVQRSVRNEGGQFIDSGYVPRAAGTVLENRFGDCKDQAVLAASLLRELRIEARLALVNSKQETTMPYLPSPRFTHVIVRAETREGAVHWIDPTEKDLAFPNVPASLEGASALVIGPAPATFEAISTDPPCWNGHESSIEATVDPKGVLSVTGACRLVGEDAVLFRMVTREPREDMQRGLEALLGQAYPQPLVREVSLKAQDPGGAMVMEYALSCPTYATFAADLMILPVPWTLANVPREVAPEDRKYAMMLGTWRGCYREAVRFRLPDGYRILSTPPAVETGCDLGRFSFRSTEVEPGVYLFERLFEIDAERVDPPQYADFRRFVQEAGKTDQERVVLTKEKGAK